MRKFDELFVTLAGEAKVFKGADPKEIRKRRSAARDHHEEEAREFLSEVADLSEEIADVAKPVDAALHDPNSNLREVLEIAREDLQSIVEQAANLEDF